MSKHDAGHIFLISSFRWASSTETMATNSQFVHSRMRGGLATCGIRPSQQLHCGSFSQLLLVLASEPRGAVSNLSVMCFPPRISCRSRHIWIYTMCLSATSATHRAIGQHRAAVRHSRTRSLMRPELALPGSVQSAPRSRPKIKARGLRRED
jgi:hypothetical protein